MAVTAFCRSHCCPFIAAAAGPGLGPRPVEAAAEEAGTAGSGPGDRGEGCEDSPAVIQRLLHVGPRRIGPRPWQPCPWPFPQFSFSPGPLVPLEPPLSVSLHLRIAFFTLGASVHTTPFLCLFTLPPFGQLFSPPPGHLAFFLALRTLIPRLSLLLSFLHYFFSPHFLCLITSPSLWHLFALPL